MEQRDALTAYNDVYKEQEELYRAAIRRCGLSDCAFWVLYALRDAGRPLTQSDICAAVYQPKQTVHSALKKLLEEDVLRLTEGRDRRSKYLVLTAVGEELTARTVDRVTAAEETAMDALTAEERTRLLLLFRRYNAALRQALSTAIEEKKE